MLKARKVVSHCLHENFFFFFKLKRNLFLKGEQSNLSFNLDEKNWEAHKLPLNQKQSRDLLQWHCECSHIKTRNPIKQLFFNVFLY